MATAVLNGHGFAEGTSVSAWPAENFVNGGPPSGSSVATATVTTGALTFTGLTVGRRYVAYASGRGVAFRADEALGVDSASPEAPERTRIEYAEAAMDAVEGSVTAVQGAILYSAAWQHVDSANGNDTNDGRAVGRAKATIEAAIAALPNGGPILISPAEYNPVTTLALNGHKLIGPLVAQVAGTPIGPTVTIHHGFDGDLIAHAAGSKGGGGCNLLLNQKQKTVGNYTGAAIKGASTAGSISGYFFWDSIIITGAQGFERDIYMDGSAHASGIRSLFFNNVECFGCYTAGETVLLKRPIHAFFNAVDVVQAPATGIQQGVKITDAVSEDVQFTGKVLGDWDTEASGGGVWFLGRITGTVTARAGSANNKWFGAFAGTYSNLGASSNERGGIAPIAERKRTASIRTGAIDETLPRGQLTSAATPLGVSGRLTLLGLVLLPAGIPVTNIVVLSGSTAMVTPANQWMTLVRVSDLSVLAKTADDTTTAWAISAEKSLAISGGPYTPSVDTLAYVGLVIAAATMPTVAGVTDVPAAAALAPALGGLSTSALTNPASLGATANAPTVTGSQGYAWIS